MNKIAAPASAPAGIAAFQIAFPIQEGKSGYLPASGFLHRQSLQVGDSWPVSVAPALGGSFRPSPGATGGIMAPGVPSAASTPAPPRMRMPRFELAALGGITDVDEAPAPTTPPVCESWMPLPAAQPAERFLEFALADAMPSSIAARQPDIGCLGPAGTHMRRISTLARSLQPELVAVSVWPVLDSRPIAYRRTPAHLRFCIHAVDEPAGQPPVAMQAPEPCGARPGLAPMPVESMPAVAAFQPAVMPLSLSLRLPAIGCLTAQVLPQAHSVEGLAAAAVESMPLVAKMAPAAIDARLSLRFPTLARFQPVDEPTAALAAPVGAPGPSPVESRPACGVFAAVPLPVAPALVARTFRAEMVAAFGYPVVASPAPIAAEPPMALPQPALLDPLSRIAAQPAGAQPERPSPTIPQPGLVQLEYYCNRIASAPAISLESIPPRLTMTLQPFAIPAALGNLAALLKKKPSRLVLPFEEIFAKDQPKSSNGRVHITTAGKIAATIMVGLALWTGSRMANLSQQTEELKAQVAASERTVTVAEAHGSDPTVGNFGKGPIGKLRKAIAERAATEITDTFRSGMAAWGAESKSWAPGWKHHPEGYVSTGDMALFQPSLKYTDYHMEFYGQIEGKSLGWVVRAKDKKNYYAMKFTVIEPGLRPMIAMVHYGVVNGKPGRKFETPLSVMVHNNTPLHVDVNVRGNRYTASIEGEQVDTWTDDTFTQGGVGFFSDAGDKARLYWMKLSRNQDWVGRFCAYLSGDARSKQQTAELWGPGIPPASPDDVPQPVHPRMPEVALAVARAGLDDFNYLQKAKTAKHRRSDAWIS